MKARRHPKQIAVIWPRPRRERWRAGFDRPGNEPDQSDALLYLEEHGFRVSIEETTPFPLNPLARMHEMYSGLDVARTLRLLSRLRRYDAIVGVGDAVAFFLMQIKRLFGLRTPIVMVDPALSRSYPRRQWLQDRVLPFADKVIVFGQVQLEFLQERYGTRVDAEFLAHRIDTGFFCPADEARTLADASDRAKPSPTVFSVGFDAGRDFETLRRAIGLCRQWGRSDVDCWIKTNMAVDATDGVRIVRDNLSWVELRELYRRAAVVALPLCDTLNASGINTLLEAMAVGRPVVVSNSRGIADYVADQETASLVPTGDAEAMARAIIRLIDDPVQASKMGQRAREFVLGACDSRVYAASMARILTDVIERSSDRRPGRRDVEQAEPSAVAT